MQPITILSQSSDDEEIKTLVTSVIKAKNQDIVERLEDPEDKLAGF